MKIIGNILTFISIAGVLVILSMLAFGVLNLLHEILK